MTVDVERLLQRLNIPARRCGREWEAHCPAIFHPPSRHPTWLIRDDPYSVKNSAHHCWPCGFGGGPVALVMEVLGLDAREAKAWLAEEDGAANARPVASEVEISVEARGAFRLPAGVVVAPLEEWPASARAYAESREITAEQVERWGVGYAVSGRLRGRIVFVKRDSLGVPAGYSARTFTGSAKKYLEAVSWENPDPSVMFGEQHWRPGDVVLLEGAINAFAVERAIRYTPLECSVAVTSGSELSPIHASKLVAFDRVIVLSDPDEAGDKLARNVDAALARHVPVVRVNLPEGKDAQTVPERYLREALEEA